MSVNPMEASTAQGGGQRAGVRREIQSVNHLRFPFLGLTGLTLHPAAAAFPGLAETACPAARSRCHSSDMRRLELESSDALCPRCPPGCPCEASEQRGAEIPLRSVTPGSTGSAATSCFRWGELFAWGCNRGVSPCWGDPCPKPPWRAGVPLPGVSATGFAQMVPPWLGAGLLCPPVPVVRMGPGCPALPVCTGMGLAAPPPCVLAPLRAQRATRR